MAVPRRSDVEAGLRVLQVSACDFGGGAENVAWNLFQAYRARGYGAWLAVGCKQSDDPDVFLVPNDAYRSWWARMWSRIGALFQPLVEQGRGLERFRNIHRWVGEPGKWLDLRRGYEDFHFPGTRRLLMLTLEPPDIVHCHNLHGDYFDLRVLPWLSQQVPVLLTLHDAWPLSGHCAHSFDCQRWKTGCGHCPDLTIYPAIRRDATAYNWQRKQKIYSKSRLYVATPSRWLMQKVEQSMLAPAIIGARVIPNGIDMSVFHPADREEARTTLNIPQDARVLLFAANCIRANIWKDYQTLRAAIAIVAEHLHNQDVLFIALGEDAPAEQIGQAEVYFVPFQKDPEIVARYYQAADVYAHAAKVDTFPNTVLEALACGTPVVATAVGGIPEQIEDGATGFLVPPGDSGAMAARIKQLLCDDTSRRQIGEHAAEAARHYFDLERQVSDYLEWYWQIIPLASNERLS